MIEISAPQIGADEIAAATRVLASGKLAMGDEVRAFEAEFSERHGAEHAVAVSSGTAALTLLLLAHGIGPGDEVILPSFTFFATAEAVVSCGATPVFVDIDQTFNINPKCVAEAMTMRTRAIIAVHLFGLPADMDVLNFIADEHGGTLVFEDACQAHGTSLGGESDGAAYSFYPTKNMTTLEGGMVLVQEPHVAEHLRMARNHGCTKAYDHKFCSGNYKMTEASAAIGRVQLQKLDAMTMKRRENALAYTNAILKRGIHATPPLWATSHVYNQYTVLVDPEKRDLLVDALAEQGIRARVYYPKGVHEYPMFNDGKRLPVTEDVCRRCLSLPVHPGVTMEDIDRVVNALGALT